MSAIAHHKLIAFVSVLMTAFALTPRLAAEEVIIVANSETELSDDREAAVVRLRQMYLKQSNSWPNGMQTQPFARSHGSVEQRAFEALILGMSETQLESHWLRLKQTRGETPPKAIASDRIFLRQIARKPGAFGAITRSSFDAVGGEGMVIILQLDVSIAPDEPQ